ncbi:MAG: hypothetical protein A2138_19175 [Deltaproteobacteria bacterium RBG_16_71_12]|nr:MAG: hypothetical protein A2138_19175 [Deltaproteobacteria bacterium RBG_16_71_12]
MVGPVRQATGGFNVATFDPNQPPPYLRGLLGANPSLAGDLVADVGLRAFVDANRSSLVQFEKPPPGTVADRVTWHTWCHATTIVPPAVRDEEYIVIVARGSAYQNAGQVQLPLQGGGTATSDGRIVWIGKTKDLLGSACPENDPHYPGSMTVDVVLDVVGRPGEQIELAYARVKPDAQGRVHRSRSGWPDSFRGVFGGYSGRELDLTLAGGRNQVVDAPDGLSTRSMGRLV